MEKLIGLSWALVLVLAGLSIILWSLKILAMHGAISLFLMFLGVWLIIIGIKMKFHTLVMGTGLVLFAMGLLWISGVLNLWLMVGIILVMMGLIYSINILKSRHS
ncbi:MAG: hypothetical protein DRN15_06690 [Thermoprotei archaeon]|mgnify:CR=1 FL=1|nr:MAG: hypothetical protein DRN15_06690 [Thermoprotei archaeon]